MTRKSVQEIKARDIMSRQLITVTPDDDVSLALGKMQQHDVNEVPVVSGKRLVGLVSYDTLLKRRSIPMTTRVENIMGFPPRVELNASVMEIAETLLSSGYRAVPVTEREKIKGIVSRTDLLNIIPALNILKEIPIREIMTSSPHFILESDTVDHARSIMYKLDVRAMPVTDENNKLVGVVGLKDLAQVSYHKKSRQTRGDVAGGKSSASKVEVKSVMNTPAITIGPDYKLADAVRLMNDNDISTVIVTDNEIPVGIVTQYDLIELIASFKVEEQVYVQISGLHETDSEAYDMMFDLIQKSVKRLGKLVKPKIFTIHVTAQEAGSDHTSGNVQLRGRMTTEHEMFYATAIDWDLMKALSEMLSQMERSVRKEKEKRQDAERQRNR
jgi:CBS domain-containing protein/ribosome-associated translation inhibitor RaiA